MSTRNTVVRVKASRPFWKDPRFLLGLALIAASILANLWLLDAARSGQAIYQSSRPIAQGEPITTDNTTIVQVRPGSDAYLAQGALHPGALARHSIGNGELIAASAIVYEEDMTKRRLVVTIAEGLTETINTGDTLELWSVPAPTLSESAEDEGARVIASNAVLVAKLPALAGFANTGSRIEVLVDYDDVAAILNILSTRGELAAVPVGSHE